MGKIEWPIWVVIIGGPIVFYIMGQNAGRMEGENEGYRKCMEEQEK